MRPGCDRAAEARLSYDAIGCQVWLDELAERPGRNQEICGLHAGRLTVPRGWMLCDRRDDEPALFVAAAPVAPAAVAAVADATTGRATGRPGRRRRSEAARHPAATLELFSEPAVETAVETIEVVEVVETEQIVETVETGETEQVVESVEVETVETVEAPEIAEDELPAALRATSPLLARAFAATGHQRSVLTQRTDRREEPSD